MKQRRLWTMDLLCTFVIVMAKKNDWKKREGIVYSTESEFAYKYEHAKEEHTLRPEQQHLKVLLDKNGRAGKQVTVVSGFTGTTGDLEALGKLLKSRCGVGGAVKDGMILIQGDRREQVVGILVAQGYRAKRSG